MIIKGTHIFYMCAFLYGFYLERKSNIIQHVHLKIHHFDDSKV